MTVLSGVFGKLRATGGTEGEEGLQREYGCVCVVGGVEEVCVRVGVSWGNV